MPQSPVATRTGVGSKSSGASSPSLLLTVAEAAVELRISRDSVYRLISKGALPTTDVSAGEERTRTRIARSAVEEFIASRTTQRPARTA